MRSHPLLAIGALFALEVAASSAFAQPEAPAPGPAPVDCRSAAMMFERSAGLPPGLLLAIGRVESGRLDQVTGDIDPWPWATNLHGEGRYFASAHEAIDWVAAQRASGERSIDVGCFQVNLQYHPNAFASLAEAFDPAANARYAALLLNQLHERGGGWPLAVALYHSADPFEGQQYSSRVAEAWNSGGRLLDFFSTPAPRPNDPVVVRRSAGASVVRVVVPAWATEQIAASAPVERPGLPRVFTPGHDPQRSGLLR